FLRDVSGANIHVDWKTLEAAGVTKDTQINLRLKGVTLARVLDLVLKEAGGGTLLTYFPDRGVIEVTTQEVADKQTYTRVYDISDLILEIVDAKAAPDFNITSNTSGGGGRGRG